MTWANIKLIFKREIRDQLRDRRTLFMVFVLPVILYPALAIGMVSLTIQGKARLEARGYKVGVVGAKRDFGLLSEDQRYFNMGLFQDVPTTQPNGKPTAEDPERSARRTRLNVITEEVGPEQVDAGKLDVLVTFGPDFKLDEDQSAPVRLHYNSANEKSRFAAAEVRDILEQWKQQIRIQRLQARDMPTAFLQPIDVSEQDHATPAEAGGARWYRLFTFLLVIMALTGAFYPSVDLCAGEKERGTMETLLISPATRSEIVMGKYLTVWLASIATALLNLAGMGLTAWHIAGLMQQTPGGESVQFGISVLSIVWMLILLVPLAALFSASCLAMATFARSTKEGQYYLTPLFIVTFPLVLMTMTPGIELNPLLACVPVTGTALLLKELMQGHYQTGYLYALPVLASTTFYAYLALHWTVGLFRKESVLFREAEKFDVRLWAQSLLADKRPTPSPAMAMAAFLLIAGLMFFMAPRVPRGNLPVTLLVTQLAFVLTPILVMTGFLTSSYRRTLLLRWPGWVWLAVAAALAVVMQPLVMEFFHWLRQYVAIPEEYRGLEQKLAEARAAMPVLLFVGLALAPGICEELAFRGFVMNGMLRTHRLTGAIFISALLFAAVHLNPIQFPNALILGLVLGLLAVRSGSILPGIVFHVTHNGLTALGAHELLFSQEHAWLARTVDGEPLFSLPVLAISAIITAVLIGLVLRKPTRVPVRTEEA